MLFITISDSRAPYQTLTAQTCLFWPGILRQEVAHQCRPALDRGRTHSCMLFYDARPIRPEFQHADPAPSRTPRCRSASRRRPCARYPSGQYASGQSGCPVSPSLHAVARAHPCRLPEIALAPPKHLQSRRPRQMSLTCDSSDPVPSLLSARSGGALAGRVCIPAAPDRLAEDPPRGHPRISNIRHCCGLAPGRVLTRSQENFCERSRWRLRLIVTESLVMPTRE